MTLKLLNDHDLHKYCMSYKFIHIGLVQVAFKPLTLEGLQESFIAALRDGRNLNWKQSLMSIIQSSLAHGAIYFNVYHNLQLSLIDINILDALTLNIKMHGYNYAPGTKVIPVCYLIYYKPLSTLNPQCRMVDKPLNETILIETNFSKSEITTRRFIKWEEITFLNNWIIEQVVPPQSLTHNNPTNIIQTSYGNIHIQFEKARRSLDYIFRPSSSKSNHSYISSVDYIVKSPSRSSTSRIREYESNDKVEELRIPTNNIVYGIYHPTYADMTAS